MRRETTKFSVSRPRLAPGTPNTKKGVAAICTLVFRSVYRYVSLNDGDKF